MDSALQKRIERAHILHAAGHSTKDIAQQYKLTTRTIRRYLATTLDDETMAAIEVGSKEDIERFAADAWRITHKLTAQIEEKLDSGEYKAKDLAISLGIISDKLRAIAPQVVEEETETVRTVFTMFSPKEIEEEARKLFEEWKVKYLAGETIKGLTGEIIEVEDNNEDGYEEDAQCLDS